MIRRRPPFWLSALNYYILVVAVAAALFFVLWGVLHDGGEEVPWVGAGLAASIVIAGAVFLREFILRISHGRQAAEQRIGVALLNNASKARRSEKLTIEKNAVLLDEIKRKSDAAKILDRLPEGHREVFEMCGRYLSINSKELAKVSPSSPRLAALLKGKDAVETYHKFHLLKWAEIESKHFSTEARTRTRISQKIEFAQKALETISSARDFYPNEEELKLSEEALLEFIASIKLGNLIERGEKAAAKGNHVHARRLYREALGFLKRDGSRLYDHPEIAARLADEVARMDELSGNGKRTLELPDDNK